MNKRLSHKDIEIIQQKTVYHGYFRIEKFNVRFRLFSGDWGTPVSRELFERGNSVVVLLYDPVLDQVVLTEQFRIGALKDKQSPWLIELVAGVIEENEHPEAVARREAQEETGLVFSDLLPIYNYWVSPGGSSEKVTLFCARVDASHAHGIHGLVEENEDIRVFNMDVEKAFEAVVQGKINNAHAIIGLQWLQINQKKLQKNWILKNK